MSRPASHPCIRLARAAVPAAVACVLLVACVPSPPAAEQAATEQPTPTPTTVATCTIEQLETVYSGFDLPPTTGEYADVRAGFAEAWLLAEAPAVCTATWDYRIYGATYSVAVLDGGQATYDAVVAAAAAEGCVLETTPDEAYEHCALASDDAIGIAPFDEHTAETAGFGATDDLLIVIYGTAAE